jgi:hypothetical protein
MSKRAYLIVWSSFKQAVYLGVNANTHSIMLFGGGMKPIDANNPKKTAFRETREETGGLYNGSTQNFRNVLNEDDIYVYSEDYHLHLGKKISAGCKECSAILKVPAVEIRKIASGNEQEFAKALLTYVQGHTESIRPTAGKALAEIKIAGSDFTSTHGWKTTIALHRFAKSVTSWNNDIELI